MKRIKNYKLFESISEIEDVNDIFVDLIDLEYVKIETEDLFMEFENQYRKGIKIKIDLIASITDIKEDLEFSINRLKSHFGDKYKRSWITLYNRRRSSSDFSQIEPRNIYFTDLKEYFNNESHLTSKYLGYIEVNFKTNWIYKNSSF